MSSFDYEKYEQEKRERKRLRSRQRQLTKRFLQNIGQLSEQTWNDYAMQFQENLDYDTKLDPYWIDTERYLIAIYNLFVGLGFKVYYGSMPRISGIDSDYRFPILAYDNNRAILIENNPSYLFADLADIQPKIPIPIIGLSYNSIVFSPGGRGNDYAIDSLKRSRSIAGALALGHLTFSLETMRQAILLNPYKQNDELIKLAKHMGLVDFLRPPVDALPVFGQQVSTNNDLTYDIDQFLKDAKITSNTGSELSRGDVTQADPHEALVDPDYYFRELEKAKLLKTEKHGGLSATSQGTAYIRSRILPFPLNQLLYYTCLAAREEVQKGTKAAFLEAINQGRIQTTSETLPLFIPIDEIDSFAAVCFYPPSLVNVKMPLENSEAEIKELLQHIISDPFIKSDWGGEQNDIYSTRVVRNGKRVLTAFFLKGPSVGGRLTLAKCGKNGDQIQRLFQSPADMFVIQFNGEIDERVIEECRQKVRFLRQMQNKQAFLQQLMVSIPPD